MTAAWSRTRLGELVRIKHGFAFSGMNQGLDKNLPVVVAIGNFDYSGGFRFGSTSTKRYAGSYPDEFRLSPGDVLLAMTCQTSGGEILGVPGVIPADGQVYLHNQRLGKVEVADPTRIDLGFVFQLARWSEFNQHLFATSSGTKILHTSPGRIEDFTFDLPPIGEQRAIAATIGALDDKIESNRRAIAILQTLIRTLFQKWRSTSPAERVSTFGEFADIYGGATPKTGVADYWSGDIAWATPTDITALDAPYLHATTRTISESGLASMSAKLQPVGTILMTSRATIGAFAVNEVPTATNQGFIAVRPRHAVHRWFLLEEMRSRVPEMLDRANGSTFMELSRGSFKSMSIGIPSASAITELHALLDPLHSRSSQLDRECAKLAAARQAVLPELLSGRVHVGDVQG